MTMFQAHHAPLSDAWPTLNALVRNRALTQPDAIAYTFLRDGEADALTYAELDQRAHHLAAVLRSHANPGTRALLICPPGLDYIVGFFGCLYAGIVVVPTYPPRLNRPDARLNAILADSQATLALTTPEILAGSERRFAHTPELATLHWIDLTAVTAEAAQVEPVDSAAINADVEGRALAFLQYTSGSTAMPRGCMLTHRNLLHNLGLIRDAFEVTPRDVGVIWLPPYHDMGLIGGILTPLYGGFPVTLMAPVAFLQRPLRWLQAISRTRATISGGPNSAFEYCARQISPEAARELDLSSWDVAFIGAEPIRTDTLERFARAFEPSGFRREAFHPCYGMAENTLMITGGMKGRRPVSIQVDRAALEQRRIVRVDEAEVEAQDLVSCGRVMGTQHLHVVDPLSGRACVSGEIGELWLAGDSVAAGYWNQSEQSQAAFQARLDGDSNPYLRTGDLGCVIDSEVYVTGRLKEVIIIRGRNFYPQDIEQAALASHPALLPDASAAFAVPGDGEEQLVLVQEIDRHTKASDWDHIAAAARGGVADAHRVRVHTVVLVRPGSIPKTSSGKIQRLACRAKYLAGELAPLFVSESHAELATPVFACDLPAPVVREKTDVTGALAAHIAQQMGAPLERSHIDVPLTALGIDSLAATELIHHVERTYRVLVPLASLLDDMTLAQLSASIVQSVSEMALAPSSVPPPIQRNTRTETPVNTIPASPPSESFDAINDATSVLAPAQERMWFLDQLDPGRPVYNIAAALRLKGALNADILQRALNDIVARHEVLRTGFVSQGGVPHAVVSADAQVTLRTADVSASTDPEAAALAQAEADARQSFDLSQPPLLRTLLIRLREQDYLLALTVHHIVSDGWSMGVLMRELTALYAAFERDQASPFPQPALHYSDFAHWQRDWLAKPNALDAQINWWRQSLGGILPLIDLPADHPRPPMPSQRGGVHHFAVPHEVAQQLRELARAEGATLFMVMTAALQTLLFRYTGQPDQLIGTPVAGRPRPELEPLIGLFVNTIVMRNDYSGDPTFREVLRRVRENGLLALANQDVPFERLVEFAQTSRDMSHSPIFQVMIAAQPPVPAKTLGNLQVTSVPLSTQTAKFDLTLFVEDTGGPVNCIFEFNTDILEPATVARYASHFVTLLQAVADNPQQRLSRLPLLPEAERDLVLHGWNAQTQRAYPSGMLMHEPFEAQAARTPNAIALWHAGQTLTYAELNARANQWAHQLIALGAGPGTFVGVCMDRSPALIVALLAVLKSGAAYVPLDPAYPPERLAFMLSDTRAPILLTQRQLDLNLPAHGAQVLYADVEGAVAAFPTHNPDRKNSAEDLAYIIYTSGSTGRPKGVALTHRSAATFLAWAQEVFTQEELRGVLAATSVCFDLSIFEIFLPISVGGTIVLVDNALAASGLSPEAGVTLINTVPSAMTELLRLKGVPATVTTVNLAGEPLPRKLVDDIYTGGQVQRIYNLYGPSEDTTYSTYALVPPDEKRGPLIGRPVANTQAYILDAQLEPQPIGVPGELYLAGEGLARGYLGRPDLTAERFVPNPFGASTVTRMYYTGDIARFLADGQIDFLGRRDHQVKLRGFRIELGEIEAALAKHPDVHEVAVVARADTGRDETPGDKRLVAYVVTQPGRELSTNSLRAHLRSSLPEYMVPAVFVGLDALPLSPNGKIDRKALPAPSREVADSAEFVAPRNEVEGKVAAIWAEVLGVERIGVNDSFFELGGHSLLATQIIARVREQFNVDVALRGLFEQPTIAALAELVVVAPAVRNDVPEIKPISRGKKDLAQLLSQIDELTDEEVQALLARRAGKKN